MCVYVFSPPFFFFFFNSDPSHQQVVINLGLVYKVQHHSGVIFQFVAFIRKRKRTVPDIIAAGGRYDHLVGLIATLSVCGGHVPAVSVQCPHWVQLCTPRLWSFGVRRLPYRSPLL